MASSVARDNLEPVARSITDCTSSFPWIWAFSQEFSNTTSRAVLQQVQGFLHHERLFVVVVVVVFIFALAFIIVVIFIGSIIRGRSWIHHSRGILIYLNTGRMLNRCVE
jgi:hypothetical protein